MNILFICDEYPPGKHGGIGTVVQTLGRELIKQGHLVFVVGLYAYSYGEKDYEEDEGVKVWRLRYGINFHAPAHHIINKAFNKIPDFIKRHLNGKKAFARFIDFINKLIVFENIDVIEIADWNTFAMRIGFLVSYPNFGVPLIVKSHGSYTKICYETKQTPKAKFLNIDQGLYNRADALSAVSNHTAEINKFLFKPNKEIKTLYNGINISVFNSSRERKSNKIIYTGTLSEMKGVFQLMRSWNLVHKKHSNVMLEVYGKGNVETLKKILNPETISSVHFMGHVNRMQLFEALSEASIAVFPSYSESFALAPMEAMAVGCPVIYTERASGKELITDGENGTLVNPDNIENMAEKINELLEKKQMRKKYSTNGKQTIENRFQISHIAKEHIAYYQTVINHFHNKRHETTI